MLGVAKTRGFRRDALPCREFPRYRLLFPPGNGGGEDEGGIMKQHESMEGAEGVDDAGWIPPTDRRRGRRRVGEGSPRCLRGDSG